MIRAKTGLTLIELLAAVVILSLAAVAGARITRSARTAAQAAQLRLGALTALDRWNVQTRSRHGSAQWEWTDEQGRNWRITQETTPSSPESEPPEDAKIQFEWTRITVRFKSQEDEQRTFLFNGVAPPEIEEDQSNELMGAP